jgi:hypothetical protein
MIGPALKMMNITSGKNSFVNTGLQLNWKVIAGLMTPYSFRWRRHCVLRLSPIFQTFPPRSVVLLPLCVVLSSVWWFFDITKFPGENVPIACLRLKAVAKALGNNDLPKNIIRKVLEGFSKSSTKTFNDVCASQIALRCGSLIQDVVKGTSLYTQLVGLLTDLENAYLELVGGQLWEGVGHPGLDQYNSSFKAIAGKPQEQKNLRDGLPWEEWVKKYAKCNHCGEIGHIRPTCSKYLAAIESGQIKRPDKKASRDLGRRPKTREGAHTPRRDFLNDPKARSFLSAVKSMMFDSDDSGDESDNNNKEATQEDHDDSENAHADDDDDLQGFLSMIGSLKD